GIALASVEDVVETALADPMEASLLGVDTGLPILLVHRTGRDAQGRPVEWTRSVFRGDRFRFVARHGVTDGVPA
ncbi:MAG: UTRA domain-containing protein, partial [Nakamurella sp.]